ncbi:glycosyltransferase family 4 protein [Mongoliitalea lutea]|uniref:Uncharacterized protein n=1 Tax=Mongoliitalea lutea TaxID=849756 RepID=A0A8J3CV04_9BACT|nr:glycosyltransferase family 4 protein [Mongoliitalea lutea]GHB23765.1 hypothetical protein GCM10008106_00440 [Mongoliitalea lutea]
MKLLLTQDALVNAGAERSHLEILYRFSQDIEVTVVYFYPKHELKEAYEKADIRLIFLDIPESYHFVKAITKLVRLIKQEKPDLLISCLWRADIITRMASLLTRVPLVGTLVNDSYAPIAWKDKHGLKYKLVYWLDRLTAEIPIHWIANAQALADSHVKTLGIAKEKISVVYRGRPVPAQSRPHKTEPIKHFISFGRLLERKGFQDAIEAFAQILPSNPDCTLTIFGEGPFRKQLETKINSLGLSNSVFLPGKIADPMKVLLRGYSPEATVNGQQSTDNCPPFTDHCSLFTPDCFLFPSWYEGFSGALVEAMMAGMPIIASDIPMNLEAVNDQESALIYPVGNSQVLAQKIAWLQSDPQLAKTMGQRARIIALERFTIETIAQTYEQILHRIFDFRTKKSLKVV